MNVQRESEPQLGPEFEQQRIKRKRVLGLIWILFGLGVIVVAVLQVAMAVEADRPVSEGFVVRISYDESKRTMHRLFPFAFLQGVAGAALAMYGARVRRLASVEQSESEQAPE